MHGKILSYILIYLALRGLLLFNSDLTLNPDELTMWQIAANHIEGHGYTFQGEENSYHSSFCVMMYEALQKGGVSLQTWQWISEIISILLFIISVFYFRQLLGYFVNARFALWGTLLYLFYPSIIYYIGSMNLYENSVMPLMVIVITVLAGNLKTARPVSGWQSAFILTVAVISSYLRPSTLFIFCFLFVICALWRFKHAYIFLFMLFALCILQAPAFIKHKQQFGSYALSNQIGFELLQGHNVNARGSHMRVPFAQEDGLYEYARQHISGFDTLNQYQESQARAALAVDWIKKNPGAEVMLDFRKIIIYFLPQNYRVLKTSNWYNPLNLLVHLGFLAFLIRMFVRRPWKGQDILLVTIPIACLILTIVFFVVYRVRYYAEPFMIICAISVFERFIIKYGSAWNFLKIFKISFPHIRLPV